MTEKAPETDSQTPDIPMADQSSTEIQKYLNQSDTVVIYPEPVSDGDDEDEETSTSQDLGRLSL